MEPKEVFDELKTILVTRLKFDPRRAVDLTLETTLPKGIESSIGLDSLDFIELSIAIEERFGIAMDESADLAPHFTSFETLSRFIASRTTGARFYAIACVHGRMPKLSARTARPSKHAMAWTRSLLILTLPNGSRLRASTL